MSIKTVAMLLEKEFPVDLRVMNEALALRDAGMRVVIFCLNFGDRAAVEEIDERIIVVRRRISRWWFNKVHVTVGWLPFYNAWWRRFVLSSGIKADAVHVHDLPLARVGWSLADRFGLKWVLDLHENYPAALKIWQFSRSWPGCWIYRQKPWKRYEKKAVRRADRVIVVIDEAMQRFLHAGFKAELFSVVCNTPDLDSIRKIDFNQRLDGFEGHLNLVFIGGLGRHRGLECVISRLPHLRKTIPTIKLWLAGEGKERPVLQALARQMGVADLIEFSGWLCFEKAMKTVYQSDIALLPHLSTEHTETTIPHKLFQYMYLKKPVIASDCRPIRRILTQSGAGLIFSPQQPQTFDDCVFQLQKGQLRQELGKRGHQAVVNSYNWKKSSETLVEIYNEFFT